MNEPFRWILVAHLVRPQGRKGEILADLHTDFPERFTTHPSVYLAAPGFAGPPDQAAHREIADHWLPLGRSSGRIVLHFTGIDSITAAETLLGKDVLVPWEARTILEDDAAYIHDLIGCQVFDNDLLAGLVEDVQFATSSEGGSRIDETAPLLLVRSPDGKEILIPYVKDFLVSINLPARSIHMRLPEGLLDLNP